MLETFTAETFASRLHQRFALVDRDAAHELELTDVTESGRGTPEGRAPFSILFRGPDAPTLPQRTYRLEHVELGAFELFLVPIGPGQYEAVFS
jgi:hypothetical protein